MLRRLIVTAIAAVLCLVLLTLENRCSYFLGTQDLVAVVTPEPVATPAPAPGKEAAEKEAPPQPYRLQFENVAGNIVTPTADDIATLKERLHGNPARDQKPIPLIGDIIWSPDSPAVHFTVPGSVSEEDVHARLQALGYKRPNPPRPLLHLTEGIDLRGGVEFVCRLHKDDGTVVPADDEVVHTLRSRLDERGLTEPQVTRLSNGDVDVVIPGGTPAEEARTRKVLETTGRLEFRHVINPFLDRPYDNRRGCTAYQLVNDPGQTPMVIRNSHNQWDLNPAYHGLRSRNRSEIVAPDNSTPGEPANHIFYLCGRPELVGSDVANASEGYHDGSPCVEIEFSAIGAARNDTFTHEAMEEENNHTGTGVIAILFDGTVRSAPIVLSPSSQSCEITGTFTPEEIENLRTALKGGSLAVTPVVLSERVVGATLGEQTVFRSVFSMAVSFAMIVAFMWLYYRRLGTVANLCLLATTFFIWCTLSVFDATVTLPGLAGLVLTIGMAVDTNILIFERIREELAEEKGLKAAIAAGYDRAFLTIVDAHLTTFITAFILYWIGTGPVKGFGLTLMIGIVVNLFSGVYIGRMLTDWLCRNRQGLSMARWIPVLKLPYVEWRWYGYVFSIVTSVAGIAWFCWGHLVTGGSFQRNFDIDFTGGNAAQVVFRHDMTLAEVRGDIDKAYASDHKAFELLNPSELRIQPYFASLTGDHKASREWVFRGRDEQGGALEHQRNELERQRGELLAKITELRESHGQQDPTAKQLETEQLLPLDAKIKTLGEQISSRTDEFKLALQKAFGNAVGHDGDEILQASAHDTTVTLQLEVLEPVDQDQLAGIQQTLAVGSTYTSVQPRFAQEDGKDVLTVTATLHALPAPRELDAHEPITHRMIELIDHGAAPTAAASHSQEIAAALDLYKSSAAAAATRRVTIAKPFPSSEHFSGQVAGQMQVRALIAIVLSLIAILAYVAARFEFSFGMGAVISLLHDVTMTVGVISLLGIRIDLTVIAAILTIIGYSINDRIVTFDRIRENLRKLTLPFAEIIDLSIAQTMPRTVLTTATVVITALVLLLFGGDALYAFNATLLIGLISGTYSSVFVASPLLLAFRRPVIEPEQGSDGGSPPAAAGRIGAPAHQS